MDTAFLADQARTGDAAVFQPLYDRIAPALYAFVRLRTHGAMAGFDAQDVMQEVWLRALRELEAFDSQRSFRSWILGIARNVLLQNYRKVSYDALRRGVPSAATDNSQAFDFPDSVTSISARLSRDEGIVHFMEFVTALDPDDRMIVVYCGFEERTCAEAATRLGLLPDTATKRWQRLRAQIRGNRACRALVLEEHD